MREFHLRRRLGLIVRAGPRELFRLGLRVLWSSSVSFGLVVDLAEPPVEPKAAQVSVVMHVHDPDSFVGFKDELALVTGANSIDVYERQGFCDAGVRTLYASVDESDNPIYAQWLVRPDNQEALHHTTNGQFPQLGEKEALLEGAYTFVRARGKGAMADGMAQLLADAREAGDRKAYTYVAVGNVPSLRGCANVGFEPDHLLIVVTRFGIRSIRHAPVDEANRALWEAAVAPRKAEAPSDRAPAAETAVS